MSLASVYATQQARVATDKVAANEAAPPSFVGSNGRAEVTETGGLRLVPASSGPMEIPSVAALAMADWINATLRD